MDKIVYMGINLGSKDSDKSFYGLYDPESGKCQEITESECLRLVTIIEDQMIEMTGYLPLNIKPEWL